MGMRPSDRAIARLPSTQRPILLVVIDTEEEFDWTAPFDRGETAVKAMREIHRAQQLFDGFGIRPTYVVDYPVASQPDGFLPLKEIFDTGRAELGAHLHPWVNPPFEEVVSAHNSFAGNLGCELEAGKLRILTDVLEQSFQVRPVVYKAGRYGIGPNTPGILEEQGYQMDLSVSTAYDWSDEGGPDFSLFPSNPFWFGTDDCLLEIPTTGAFLGFPWGIEHIVKLATTPLGQITHLPGILHRTRVAYRIQLSPEIAGAVQHRKLTRRLLRRGERVFNFAFHSPSMKPGCTPFVRSERDRDALLDTCRRYFDHFLGDLNGIAMTPTELKAHLLVADEKTTR